MMHSLICPRSHGWSNAAILMTQPGPESSLFIHQWGFGGPRDDLGGGKAQKMWRSMTDVPGTYTQVGQTTQRAAGYARAQLWKFPMWLQPAAEGGKLCHNGVSPAWMILQSAGDPVQRQGLMPWAWLRDWKHFLFFSFLLLWSSFTFITRFTLLNYNLDFFSLLVRLSSHLGHL